MVIDVATAKEVRKKIAEEARAEGFAEGLVQAREILFEENKSKGKAQALRQIAINLMDVLDDEVIACKTELPLEEVQKLRRDSESLINT